MQALSEFIRVLPVLNGVRQLRPVLLYWVDQHKSKPLLNYLKYIENPPIRLDFISNLSVKEAAKYYRKCYMRDLICDVINYLKFCYAKK